MKTYKNGYRYGFTKYYDQVKNQPYDYEDEGILRHMMSQRIVNTSNPITKFMYNVFEKEIVFLLNYVDILANFKNPFFRNR